MRYFLELAYCGASYTGWQRQPNGLSVQEVVETALQQVLKEQISITGAGRTDAGVHAYRMVAHFDSLYKGLDETMPLFVPAKHLAPGIRLRRIRPVGPEAHARFSAISRTYRYFIDQEGSPYRRHYAYPFRKPLDIEAMQLACQALLGRKDFSAFARSGTDNLHFECDISKAVWYPYAGMLVFEVTANRFLRNMVRAIVGTMLDVGRGKLSPTDFESIIAGKERSAAGASAQARGLFLWDISYPDEIYL